MSARSHSQELLFSFHLLAGLKNKEGVWIMGSLEFGRHWNRDKGVRVFVLLGWFSGANYRPGLSLTRKQQC